MGWFIAIFGGEQKGLVEKVSGGLDALVFTDQEKSEMFLDYLRTTSGQNVARRYGAVIIWLLFSILVLLTVALYLFGAVEQSKYVKGILTELVLEPFMLVNAFYYAAHLVRGSQWGAK